MESLVYLLFMFALVLPGQAAEPLTSEDCTRMKWGWGPSSDPAMSKRWHHAGYGLNGERISKASSIASGGKDLATEHRERQGGLSAVGNGRVERVTPDEIRARALQRRQEQAEERVARDRENLERQRGKIREPSDLASHEEREAYKAHQIDQAIQRGEATVADLPEAYGGRPKGSSGRAIAARKAWDKAYAIQAENSLMEQGRTSEAAALRQARLKQEDSESLNRIEADTKRSDIRQEVRKELRWLGVIPY
jgi:hypothetical protein